MSKNSEPFVKWAGGKSQLLEELKNHFPAGLGTRIRKYAEPFVGGGAVLFFMLNNYDFDEIFINDSNAELIHTYKTIRDEVDGLIQILSVLQEQYLELEEESRKEFYYARRNEFNEHKEQKQFNTRTAALLIFLNRTCFNGLYRVNSKGAFNVPMGSYSNPTICDEKRLKADSEALQKVTISCGDYSLSEGFIDSSTFAYFDPPYRPLSITSSFTSYSAGDFTDQNQKELAEYIEKLTQKGAYVLASNSDPKNTNPDDDFFDSLYSNCHIDRVCARRNINSKVNSRGIITELIISNYTPGRTNDRKEFQQLA